MTQPAEIQRRPRDDREFHVLAVVHPRRDLFDRAVAAIHAEGSGVDLDDLRSRLARFRAEIDRPAKYSPARWAAFADGLAGAIDSLEAGEPRSARSALDDGLGRYIAADSARG